MESKSARLDVIFELVVALKNTEKLDFVLANM